MNDIEQAVVSFRKLLEEQLARSERMTCIKKRDFADGKPIRIALIGGDGIGPIIMRSAEQVLRVLLAGEIASGEVILVPIEGLTLENREATGKSVPDDVLAAIRTCDVLLKGPTATPKGGTLESANVTLRRELDLFANVRPVSVPEEGIDWVFFRENTEGEYLLGTRGIEIPGKLTMDFKVTTVPGTERIAEAAFSYAKTNGKTNVAIVTKANIMKKTDGSFSAVAHEVASRYPGIRAEDWYADIAAANLVNPAIRSEFQVFLLPNLYGDILTDEAAQIQGGVGTAGSANVGDSCAMFEAIHGSAPRLIEEGLGAYANPQSILRAEEMLLRHIGKTAAADRLAAALAAVPDAPDATREGVSCASYTAALLRVLSA